MWNDFFQFGNVTSSMEKQPYPRIGLVTILTILLTGRANGNLYSVEFNSIGGIAQWIPQPYKFYKQKDLDSCLETCRKHATCTAFKFHINHVFGSHCTLFENALGYGPLKSDDMITGQLVSSANNAALAWLGIGHFDYPFNLGKESYSKASAAKQCEEFCDNTKAQVDSDGAECVQWDSGGDCTNNTACCFASANAFIETTKTGKRTVGMLANLNVSKTAVNGDQLMTRYTPDQFPTAPPDIGNGIPKYTEMNYHSWAGLQRWMPFELINSSSWEDCSLKCHQNPHCLSFLSTKSRDGPRQCGLFDAAILGRVQPGYDKYGIIDRSGKEGAVSSLMPALAHYQYQGWYLTSWYKDAKTLKAYEIRARILLRIYEVASFDECARHCYNFFRPVFCTGFFYFSPKKRCELHDAVPCTHSRTHVLDSDLGIGGDFYYSWDGDDESVANYKFGYIDGRLSETTLAKIDQCQRPITTTETPQRTTTPTVKQLDPRDLQPKTCPLITKGQISGPVDNIEYKNGQVLDASVSVGTVVTISCSYGLTIQPFNGATSHNIECTADWGWKNPMPKCAEKACIAFHVSNAIVEPPAGDSIAHGDEMSVRCQKGYRIGQTEAEEELFGATDQTKISCFRGELGNTKRPPSCLPFDKNEELCATISKYCPENGEKIGGCNDLDGSTCDKAIDELKNLAAEFCSKTCAEV